MSDISFAISPCSLGFVLVAATSQGVSAIFLGDDPKELIRELERRAPGARLIDADANLVKLASQVVRHIENPRASLDLPLDIRGTAFQQRVWRALRDIPFGETATYTDIARAIGAPKAVRAVAKACGANHLAVVIPCHRVVRLDGVLSGYRWGVERKRTLLAREGSIHEAPSNHIQDEPRR